MVAEHDPTYEIERNATKTDDLDQVDNIQTIRKAAVPALMSLVEVIHDFEITRWIFEEARKSEEGEKEII